MLMQENPFRTDGDWSRMTPGLSELLKRAVVGALVAAAFLVIGVRPAWVAGLLAGGAWAFYLFWPSVPRPAGAMAMHRGSAVIGPDILGFLLLGLFVALPVWVGRSEGAANLHGSALLIWPLLAAPLAILLVATAGTCFSVTLSDEGLNLSGLRGTERLEWSAIRGWRPWRRGLPGFLRSLVPFLPPTAGGAVLLARDSTGIELILADGSTRRLPREGFEPALARIEQTIAARNLPRLDPGRQRKSGA